jgi:hypothetical protein
MSFLQMRGLVHEILSIQRDDKAKSIAAELRIPCDALGIFSYVGFAGANI